MTARYSLLIGALLGITGVALGAFAAHGLHDHLGAEALATLHTGIDYQMIHAVALLACGALLAPDRPWIRLAVTLFLVGVLLFSGSLYGLVLLEWRWLGPLTPLGGLALLAGWACLAIGAVRSF